LQAAGTAGDAGTGGRGVRCEDFISELRYRRQIGRDCAQDTGRRGVSLASETRARVLAAVVDEKRPLRTLSDDLNVPRTTVSENPAVLAERGWVTSENGTYRATTLGRSVAVALDRMKATPSSAHDLEPFFEHIPDGVTGIDASVFTDARVTVATPSDPYSPTHRMQALTSGPVTFRGVSPVVYPSLSDEFHAGMRKRLEMKIVLPTDVLESARAKIDTFVPDFENPDALRVGVHDGDLDYGLGIVDGTVLLGATADSGFIEITVESDAPGLGLALLYSNDECADALSTTDNDAALDWGRPGLRPLPRRRTGPDGRLRDTRLTDGDRNLFFTGRFRPT
jgi:predicted transcriptional regulator